MIPLNFRDAVPGDLATLHALNESEVPNLGTITLQRLELLISRTAATRVALGPSGELAGFVMVFDEHGDYDSQNFLWFKSTYSQFAYVDRIAVTAGFRGQGIGRALYAEVGRLAARLGSPRITCEVNLQPPNPASMAFHLRLGFREVGTLSASADKRVSLLVKDLLKAPAG